MVTSAHKYGFQFGLMLRRRAQVTTHIFVGQVLLRQAGQLASLCVYCQRLADCGFVVRIAGLEVTLCRIAMRKL